MAIKKPLETENAIVASRLKAIREALGFKQKEFAARLGISIANVSDMENGKYKPRFDVISRLGVRFNVNIWYLIFGEGDMFGGSGGGGTSPDRIDFNSDFINKEEVKSFLRHLKQSPLVEYSILYSFRLLMAKDGDAIRKEMEESGKKKGNE
ncbi:MAG: helix-turn-helix transcriptional regulator [bacterium]|nr:helix-turn-helix transcriptional regulator [bacterium]